MVKRKKKWANQKVNEKDYMILMYIVIGLVAIYFVYSNFIPKNFDDSLKIDLIEINSECKDCFDINLVVQGLESLGIVIDDKKVLNYESGEAKKILEKYNIDKVPALIIKSKEIDQLGLGDSFSVGKDYAVFESVVPYMDIESGEVKGIVEVKEISTDCDVCLPLSTIKSQFEEMGVNIGSFESIDYESDSGKEFIRDEGLTFVPTILISTNIEEYDLIFSQIKNSLVKNGDYYTFKNGIAPYKDIVSGDIKGVVTITYIDNSSCENCFNVSSLGSSFQNLGVYIGQENSVDVSSQKGKFLLNKYNITSIPTAILSKEILDYAPLRPTLDSVGTFDLNDGSFVFRELDKLNVEYQKIG